MAKTLTKLEPADALYCAKIFNDYFGQFERIDQYMKDQKLAQLEDTVSSSLPGMGPEEDLFNDFTMSPEDMDFEVYEPTDGTSYVTLLNMTSSHTNMPSIPGKELKLLVKEKNTGKIVGFIRFGSPVINSAPRNQVLGQVPDLKQFNKTAIMGFTIVPTQPFGYNYLGGKLLAAICCSHKVKDILDKKYNMNLVMFETTSLYGSSKSSSQYDGMKPYLRFKGVTDSKFIPLMHGQPYRDLNNYVEERVGLLVPAGASSRKLKMTTAVIGLLKRSLNGDDLVKFKSTIANALKLTERKRFYVSNYGVENFVDIVNGKTDTIKKAENYDRFSFENTILWWKKLATKRFNNLKADGRLRTELELWSKEANIDIIR
jgi:hypothetical protein